VRGVVVSDLSLEDGLNGSLLERITEIRFVGEEKGLKNTGFLLDNSLKIDKIQ